MAKHSQKSSHKKSRKEKPVTEPEAAAIDLSGVVSILGKVNTKTWITVALLLIPIFLAVFFRAYPATLPITDQWAESAIDRSVVNQQIQTLQQNFPHLPQESLNAQARELADTMIESQREQFDTQVALTSNEFKQRMKNDNGETYLLAIDPYTYYMDAQSILDHGHVGQEVRDGKYWQNRQQAPIGVSTTANPHSYVMIWTWKLLKLFKPNMSLMGGVFWVPVIIAALSVIPAFFIARRKTGNLGGLVAGVLVAVHSSFLGRTPGGFADTDAYNVFFPLLVAWLFLEAFKAKNLKDKLILAAGSGVALGIYSKFWTGYWYILYIVLGTIVAYFAFQLARYLYAQSRGKKKAFLETDQWISIRDALLPFGAFIVVTGIIVSAFYGFKSFYSLPMAAFGFSQLKIAAHANLWPNVLTTVAELNEVNFAGVVGNMGGKFIFTLALLGVVAAILPTKEKLKAKDFGFLGFSIVMILYLVSDKALSQNHLYTLLTKLGFAASGTLNAMTYLVLLGVPLLVGLILLINDDRKIDIKFAMLLLLWFVGTMYATTKGVRFTLVLVPGFAVAIGTLIGMLFIHLKDYLSEELDIPLHIVKPVLIILLCLVLLAPIKNAHAVALNEVPSMNDAWYGSLTHIRDTTPTDTIITSWWDFGHWFKAIAERPVTFDGGTQNTPMAHWVGKLLLTTNEDESTGILRMLDCGSYTGYDLLREHFDDAVDTKNMLDQMVLVDRSGAKDLLADAGITGTEAEDILALTHCEPPDAVVITSQDMIGKAGVWGHFGSWSFERAHIYNDLRKKPQAEAVQEMMTRFGHDEQTAQQLYFQANGFTDQREVNSWISPWPGYVSGWIGCQVQNVTVNESAINDSGEGELVERELAVCPTGINVGNQDGVDVRIEAIIVDPENPNNSRLRYGFYRGGQRVGQNDGGKPQTLFLAHAAAEDGVERVDIDGPSSGVGFLYDEEHSRALAADPLLVGSMFTQLYYLDGKYNEHFTKSTDQTSFNGQRIVVWNVDWDAQDEE